jgi:hypothetical protein
VIVLASGSNLVIGFAGHVSHSARCCLLFTRASVGWDDKSMEEWTYYRSTRSRLSPARRLRRCSDIQ